MLNEKRNKCDNVRNQVLNLKKKNQRTNGPINAHLISWPTLVKHKTYKSWKDFIKNLVQIGQVVSEKIRFEFLYVHDLPQGQEITLTLILIYLHILN